MRLYPTPAAPHTHIWHHRARYAKPLWGPLDVWVQNRMQTHRPSPISVDFYFSCVVFFGSVVFRPPPPQIVDLAVLPDPTEHAPPATRPRANPRTAVPPRATSVPKVSLRCQN